MESVINFISGVNAGVAVVVVGQPFDTIKVKLQTFSHVYPNAFKCFFGTVKHEGFKGLYAGTVPALAANIVDNAVTFLFYGFCQQFVAKLVGKQQTTLSIFENAVAGSCAGVFTGFALTPFELIKCRLQAQYEYQKLNKHVATFHKIGPFSMTMTIFREEGIVGLFRGLNVTISREIPCYFGFFLGIEGTREFLTPPGKTKDDLGIMATLAAGAAGGVCCWSLAYPIDLVKSRIQVESQTNKNMPGFFQILWTIFRKNGPLALYKGFGPVLLRTFPANAALYWSYDLTKKTLTPLCA